VGPATASNSIRAMSTQRRGLQLGPNGIVWLPNSMRSAADETRSCGTRQQASNSAVIGVGCRAGKALFVVTTPQENLRSDLPSSETCFSPSLLSAEERPLGISVRTSAFDSQQTCAPPHEMSAPPASPSQRVGEERTPCFMRTRARRPAKP